MHRTVVKALLNSIWKRYPNPVPNRGYRILRKSCYCTGGAFCLYCGSPFGVWNFPTHNLLAQCLRTCNAYLTPAKARAFADDIIDHNDSERFGPARKSLERALAWQC